MAKKSVLLLIEIYVLIEENYLSTHYLLWFFWRKVRFRDFSAPSTDEMVSKLKFSWFLFLINTQSKYPLNLFSKPFLIAV